MRHTDRIAVFIRILPFARWKSALIRRHVGRCPECGGRLATIEEARRAIVHADGAGDSERLRSRVEASIVADAAPAACATGPAAKAAPAWRWAAATAGIFAAAVAVAALVFFLEMTPPATVSRMGGDESAQFRLYYVKIGDEPAQTFVFKPHDSDVIIVWAGKTH